MKSFVLAAGALCTLASTAGAVSELFIDVNTLSASFNGGAFSTSATGSINIVSNASSTLAGVRINGVGQPVSATLATYSGRIDLVNGGVTGGFVSILNSDGTTYTADIASGVGSVSSQAGQGFSIDGLTFNGLFANNFFAGVNITPWWFTQPRPGSVITFAFNPNANGVDNNTDIDLYVLTVPTPQAAGLGLAGLLGLGAARRRR